MSKNLTRKGLALGAILALGSSLFAGTAANAADELTLAPTAGTLYKTVAGETFSLTLGLAPATPSGNIGQLAYQVVTDPAYGTVTPIALSGTLNFSLSTSTPAGASANAGTAAAPKLLTGNTTGTGTNTTVYYADTVPALGSANKLNLKATVAGTTAGSTNSAAVTAFFDANGDHIFNAGEYSSATRTVTWVRAADLTATVDLTQPSQGDTTATVSAVLDGINQEQLAYATELGFRFTTGAGAVLGSLTATTQAAAAATEDIEVAAFSALTGKFSATSATIASPIAAGTSIKATAYYLQNLAADNTAQSFVAAAGTAGTGTWLATGAVSLGSSTKAATARTIATIATSAVATENNAAVTGTANANGAAIDVRKNSEFTVSATVKDATPAVVGSVSVSATVSYTALSTIRTITLNGTTYTSGTSKVLTLTSDASGVVNVKVSTVGFSATDTVTVVFAAQGFSANIVATQRDASYTVYETSDLAASAQRSVIVNSPITLNYAVVDQFKKAVGTGYRLKATAANVSGTGVGAGDTYATIADGKASVNYTPIEKGSFTVAIVAETNATGVWGAVSNFGGGYPASTTITTLAAQTDYISGLTASYPSASVTTGDVNASNANVAAATLLSVDKRLSYTAAKTYYGHEAVKISGSVTQDVTGVLRPGAVVKIESKGVLFSTATLTQATDAATSDTVMTGAFVTAGANTIYSLDSITVIANASGAFAVTAFANVAGTYTVTVTSGTAVAATKKITFKNYLDAASLSFADVTAQAQAGSSVSVAVTVKDKYGNAITGTKSVTLDGDAGTAGIQALTNAVTDVVTYATTTGTVVSFTSTGAGYLQLTSGTTDATNKGVLANRIISAPADLGTATITASFTDPADSTATISASKSVEFGVTDADVTVGGRAVYASVEFAKGKTVTVTVDGKRLYSKLQTTDNYTELKFTQKTAGKHTVTVRVSGGIVYSETVVTTK